jgi:hypothetical protein
MLLLENILGYRNLQIARANQITIIRSLKHDIMALSYHKKMFQPLESIELFLIMAYAHESNLFPKLVKVTNCDRYYKQLKIDSRPIMDHY